MKLRGLNEACAGGSRGFPSLGPGPDGPGCTTLPNWKYAAVASGSDWDYAVKTQRLSEDIRGSASTCLNECSGSVFLQTDLRQVNGRPQGFGGESWQVEIMHGALMSA